MLLDNKKWRERCKRSIKKWDSDVVLKFWHLNYALTSKPQTNRFMKKKYSRWEPPEKQPLIGEAEACILALPHTQHTLTAIPFTSNTHTHTHRVPVPVFTKTDDCVSLTRLGWWLIFQKSSLWLCPARMSAGLAFAEVNVFHVFPNCSCCCSDHICNVMGWVMLLVFLPESVCFCGNGLVSVQSFRDFYSFSLTENDALLPWHHLSLSLLSELLSVFIFFLFFFFLCERKLKTTTIKTYFYNDISYHKIFDSFKYLSVCYRGRKRCRYEEKPVEKQFVFTEKL